MDILPLIIILLIIYLLDSSKAKFIEGMDIQFLTSSETYNFIKSDPDNYFKNFTRFDLIARSSESVDDYITKIVPLDFNEQQKEILLNIVKNINIKNFTWKFALTNNGSYEDGYPHTRTDIIFLSTNTFNNSIDNIMRTIKHEYIHVYQRQNPVAVNILLRKKGYIPFLTMDSARQLIPLLRSNPDLNNFIYKNPDGQLMYTIYSSVNPKNLADTITYPINNVVYEHPYELMAYSGEN
jgi:hypothetical protein